MKAVDVILGSARTASNGERLFNNLKRKKTELEKKNEVKLNFISLRDLNLPIFNEDVPPLAQKERHLEGAPKKWIEQILAGDGYLFIEPVYDNGLSGAFKNALDYIGGEAANKPARIICYSEGKSMGSPAQFILMPTLSMLSMIILPAITQVGSVSANFNEDGSIIAGSDGDYYADALDKAVADISKYSKFLNN